MLRIQTLILLILLCGLQPGRAAAPGEIHKSLVRITLTAQQPNYKVPWNPGEIIQGVGSGFVIDGERILTNAHVVSNARFLSIEREGDPKRYVGAVQHIGHDCDLAVLKVADPEFFKGTVPLQFGGIPEIESAVSAFGYPIGGNRASVTRGIVSRVDFQAYSHSAMDAHLVIQIDAAINPGNSGGPVMREGKVVGVAFQGYSGDVAQNTAYMIPVPVIERFLKDIADGSYDRYMDLSVTTFGLQNPAQRRALGLENDDTGVLVSSVSPAGSSAGVLKEGDVLVSIDGLSIASDGFVELDGQRVQMSEVVERKFKGDEVKVEIVRHREPQSVVVKLESAWPYLMQGSRYDVDPRYVVFGGLVFQPLSRDFLENHPTSNLRLRYFYDFFVADALYQEHPEVIVLSGVLSDPINTYLGDLQDGIVDKVNGEKIRTLAELAAAFEKDSPDYVIELVGEGRPIVLEKSAIESARERIRTRYNISEPMNLQDRRS